MRTELDQVGVAERILRLVAKDPGRAGAMARCLGLPEGVELAAALDGRALSPADLVEIAEILDVPAALLSGRIAVDRNLGVSLRLGMEMPAGATDGALAWATRLLKHRALLDSWMPEERGKLQGCPVSRDRFAAAAGAATAARVRDAAELEPDQPILDLVGLVEEARFPVIFLSLPEEVCGLNIRFEEGERVYRFVFVNSDHPWTRQRYTIAHELCHGLYDDEGGIVVDKIEPDDRVPEWRAEHFARHLLLPRAALRKEVFEERARGLRRFVPYVMFKYGLSRTAVLNALVNDEHISSAESEPLRRAGLDQLMEDAGLSDPWRELNRHQHESAGSPYLVDRGVTAYGNGWIGISVIADLLLRDEAGTAEALAAAGWSLDQ